MLVTSILFILLGFVLLIKGADFLVDGASNIAKRFHIPEIIIGLTIVSIGTSMPELVVSTTSAINGQSDMAMGNVIGSNVCNLLLILGCSKDVPKTSWQIVGYRVLWKYVLVQLWNNQKEEHNGRKQSYIQNSEG